MTRETALSLPLSQAQGRSSGVQRAMSSPVAAAAPVGDGIECPPKSSPSEVAKAAQEALSQQWPAEKIEEADRGKAMYEKEQLEHPIPCNNSRLFPQPGLQGA